MPAHIVVDNRTGHAIHVTSCGLPFQLGLESSSYHPEVAWAACRMTFTIAIGKSSYRVMIPASYYDCGPVAQGGSRACLHGRPPPLPAGEYRAVLFQSPQIVSAPAPIPVLVTPRSPGAASASSAPPASAWLAASEIPFGATYSWSLFTGNGNSAPIGTAEGNGVYYVSPDTVFQGITSCGSPSLLLSTPLGARQRQFEPTSGALRDQAGQWISSYPDAAVAQAAWHRLQAAYAACPAQAGNLPITLTETAQTPDAMAWFHSTNGARFGDRPPYAHEYFVLHETQIAYLYVEGAGPALATTPNDAQVLAAITRHLNA
jgi:hypothetical protein